MSQAFELLGRDIKQALLCSGRLAALVIRALPDAFFGYSLLFVSVTVLASQLLPGLPERNWPLLVLVALPALALCTVSAFASLRQLRPGLGRAAEAVWRNVGTAGDAS